MDFRALVSYKVIHRAADRALPAFREVVEQAFREGLHDVPRQSIRVMLTERTGNENAVVNHLERVFNKIDAALLASLPALSLDLLGITGRATGLLLRSAIGNGNNQYRQDRPTKDVARLGVIDASGVVTTVKNASGNLKHETVFAGVPRTARFRYADGQIFWNDEPTADEYFAVEDHFAEQGVTLKSQGRYMQPSYDPKKLRGAAFNEDQPRADDGKWISATGISSDDWEEWAYDSDQVNAALQGEKLVGEHTSIGDEITAEMAADYLTIGQRIDAAANQHVVLHADTYQTFYRGESFANEADLKAKYGRSFTTDRLISATPRVDIAEQYRDVEKGDPAPVKAIVRIQNINGLRGVQAVQFDQPVGEVVLARGQKFSARRTKLDDGTWQVDLYSKEKHPKGLTRIDTRTSKLRGAAVWTPFSFDADDPQAIEWARKHAADLVTQVGKTTKERIRKAVVDGFAAKSTVDDIADAIDEVLDDEDRAEVIARTETMKVANAGQQLAWGQAVDQGFLTGDELQVWITTPDDRLCPLCEALDGVTAPLGEPFESDGESYDGPPAHPQCRCSIGLQPVSIRGAAFNEDQPRDEKGQWAHVSADNVQVETKHAASADAIKGELNIQNPSFLKLTTLTNLPPHLERSHVPVSVKITDELYSPFPGNVSATTLGLYAGGTVNLVQVKAHDVGATVRGTLVHELGHAVDAIHGKDPLGSGKGWSSNKKFKEAWKEDVKNMSAEHRTRLAHYASHESEGFAEATAYLLASQYGKTVRFSVAFPRTIEATKTFYQSKGVKGFYR